MAGKLRIIPLGTSGFIPTRSRETSSILLTREQEGILLDAGTGVKRLGETSISERLSTIESLHVVLTHLHHDHVCGLTWLLRLWPKELTIWAPVEPLIEVNGVDAVTAFVNPPYFSLPLEQWPQKPAIRPLRSGTNNVGGVTMEALPQHHKGGSAGIRVGTFGYITDTEPSANHQAFLDGTRFLAVDSMFDRADYVAAAGPAGFKDHGSGETSARLAMQVGATQLGLVHLNPTFSEERLKGMLQESRTVFPPAQILVEGGEYDGES